MAATFGQPGTAGTILPNALQAGHNLVLALDRALSSGVQSGSRDDSEGLLKGPPSATGSFTSASMRSTPPVLTTPVSIPAQR